VARRDRPPSADTLRPRIVPILLAERESEPLDGANGSERCPTPIFVKGEVRRKCNSFSARGRS
jgi:hypothetical protein